MTNTALTRTETSNELKVAAAPSLIQLALAWRVVDPVPDQLGESIDELERVLMHGLNPCPLDAYVVLLDKLFVATERPSDAALKTWRERLEKYPKAILSRAIDSTLDSHVYAGSPKIAAICTAADADSEWYEMRFVQTRMRTLKAAWGRQQASKVPDVPFNPAIADTVQAAAYESQRARAKRVNAEQEQRKAERQAKYKMSPAEEAKANATALNTKTIKAAIACEGMEKSGA